MTATIVEETKSQTGAQTLAGKYLTFRLGEESYGIDVLKIREIIRLTTITAMPETPSHVKGVINLRGKVIPVVDLRMKFGLMEAEPTVQTCIVVVQAQLNDDRQTLMGLIVDGVEEVVQIATQDIEETPDFGSGVDVACILGMAKIKGAVKALLDIDRVLAGTAMQSFM